MRYRIIAAVALAVALATVASTATGSVRGASAQSVTVWVMTDAQNGWPAAIATANQQFQQQHPAST
jgi:ABC-type glycerol-3-phosphate transport system substrate-binding protein